MRALLVCSGRPSAGVMSLRSRRLGTGAKGVEETYERPQTGAEAANENEGWTMLMLADGGIGVLDAPAYLSS